ncbi:MAG: hypothetical protein ACLP22_11960, partial [Solirubrobacteraceae bacterium]
MARRLLAVVGSCLDFTLAGLAICMLVLWPLVQAAQAQQATPAAGGAGAPAAAQLQSLRTLADAERAREATPPPASARPDPLLANAARALPTARVATQPSAWVRIPGDAPIGVPSSAPSASAAS